MIYLINPISEDFVISRIGRCVTKAKADYLYPPTELLYVASYLKEKGHKVRIIDGALANSPKEILQQIKNPEYFILMVGIFSYNIDNKFIRLLKKHFPTTPVIVFGQGASFITKDYLKYADYAIFGEPEKPISEIVNGKKSITGVSYKRGKQTVINKNPNLVKNLDGLPFPARKLINNKAYRHAFLRPFAMVYSSRGCPYKCIFCTSKGYSPLYRERSADNVVQELKELHKLGIKNFGFMDDTFTINKSRVIEICKSMLRESLKLNWIALGRVDNVNYEMLKWMKRAGCKIIMYGIESFSQEVLNYMRKGIKVEQIRKAIELTKQAGIETHGFFIFGSPPDTQERIEHTIKEANKLGLDYASFNIYVPYPGTVAYEMLKQKGKIKTTSWEKYDQSLNELVFEHDSLKTGNIKALIKKAYRNFYFNSGFILRRARRDLLSPSLLLRDFANATKLAKYYR